jgi:hypothetical protein
MKPAARRASSRSASEVQAAIERFLKASSKPALLEPGEELLRLREDNFVLDPRNARLTIQAWDGRRNLVRRIIDIRHESRGRLELVAERFARKPGPLFLMDLARPAAQDWERRGARLVFRERFRQFLSREFPGWKIIELSTEQDLEHSLSPAYPRALLRKGAAGLAAIAAPPDAIDTSGIHSFGLIWLDYLRNRERRIAIEGLMLFLPLGKERTTCLRVAHLNVSVARFEVFAYSEEDYTARLDLCDSGNLDTILEVRRIPSSIHRETFARLEALGAERVELNNGEASLRVRGVEFALTSGNEIRFGLTDRVAVRHENIAELEQLACELARMRSPDRPARGDLYLRNPEAWLESQVRAKIETIDATLLPYPIYGQVPAFAGGERGVLDLLATDRGGRLAILELKASSDIHLPVQALDYWMRVNWHIGRREFAAHGYFPGVALQDTPPRLLLIGPSLEFHPTTESILAFFSPAIEVERIGLTLDWRKSMQVMFRLRGAERPR